MAMYASTAATGQRVHPVFPTYTSTPFPNWSVLECFSLTCTSNGDWTLSIEMSPHVRWSAGLNEDSVGMISSPDQKNPKKQRGAAAHSIVMSGSVALDCQWERMSLKMLGVMGSLICHGLSDC